MGGLYSRNVVDAVITSQHQRDLVWSFLPIFYPLQVLGVDAEVAPPPSRFRRRGFLALRMSMMALVLSSSLIHFEARKFQGIPGHVMDWCDLLRHTTRLVSAFLLQLAFLSMTLWRWATFWEKAEKLQQFIPFQPLLAIKIRRASCLIVTFILTLELLEKSFGTVYGVRLRKIVAGGAGMIEALGIIIGESYESILIALFTTLILLASMSIETITEDVQNDVFSFQPVTNRIGNWQRNYSMIMSFVAEVDCFFGPALIILLTKYLALSIIYSFTAVNYLYRLEFSVFSLFYLLRNCLLILLIIIGSQQMESKALYLASKLAELRFDDSATRSDVHHFISRIYQRLPSISPMGVFRVTPKIIPKFIATILTYMLIMVQFAMESPEE